MDIQIKKQFAAASEIVDSEITYTENLKKLQLFYEQAEAFKSIGKEVMTEIETKKLFMNLKDIIQLNMKLCNELINLRFKGQETFVNGIATVLLKYTPFFKIYQEYMDNFQVALHLLDDLKKRKKFKEYLLINESCCKAEISSLLILPVQRIPRYILLVKELLKYSRGIDDRIEEKLEENIYNLEKLVTKINLHPGIKEARDKVITIQQQFFHNEINIIAPHRYIVAIGKLIIYYNIQPPIKEKILLVLFNDILLWGREKPNKNGYRFKKAIPLEQLNVIPITSIYSKNYESAFLLSSKCLNYINIDVIVKNEKTRNNWLRLILAKKDELIKENKIRGVKPMSVKKIEETILKKENVIKQKINLKNRDYCALHLDEEICEI